MEVNVSVAQLATVGKRLSDQLLCGLAVGMFIFNLSGFPVGIFISKVVRLCLCPNFAVQTSRLTSSSWHCLLSARLPSHVQFP